jgi:hypothetical protein
MVWYAVHVNSSFSSGLHLCIPRFQCASLAPCCFLCAGDPHCAVRCVCIVVHAACLCLVQCFATCALPCEPSVISIHHTHVRQHLIVACMLATFAAPANGVSLARHIFNVSVNDDSTVMDSTCAVTYGTSDILARTLGLSAEVRDGLRLLSCCPRVIVLGGLTIWVYLRFG